MTGYRVELSEELLKLREEWLTLPEGEAEAFYAAHFLEPFAAGFAELLVDGLPEDYERPRALVTLLDEDWTQTALVAAWAKPERMLVLTSRDERAMKANGEPVLDIIQRLAELDSSAVSVMSVEDRDETRVYEYVRDFFDSNAERQAAVALVGSGKPLSAAVAVAAYIARKEVIAVEAREWHDERNVRLIGTEYLRVVRSPLKELGELEIAHVVELFNKGKYRAAETKAEELASQLYSPREAETLQLLAEGYDLWLRFRVDLGEDKLVAAEDHIRRFGRQWQWADERFMDALRGNIEVARQIERLELECTDCEGGVRRAQPIAPDAQLTFETGRPVVLWYRSLAEKFAARNDASQAILMSYIAAERYLALVLEATFNVRWEDSLRAQAPSFNMDEEELLQRFNEEGEKVVRERFEAFDTLPFRLTVFRGALLIRAVPELSKRAFLTEENHKMLQQLSEVRNESIYAHGFRIKHPSQNHLRGALHLLSQLTPRLFKSDEEHEAFYAKYTFPQIHRSGRGTPLG